MSQRLVTSRVRFPEASLPTMMAVRNLIVEELRKVDGFDGSTVWRKVGNPTEHLVVLEFRDAASAGYAMEHLMVADPFSEMVRVMDSPADVIEMRSVHHKGPALSHSGAAYLSLSTRASDPGMSAALLADLDIVFGELATLPGFAGWTTAVNATLEEEVFGLALWTSEEAFRTSLPQTVTYEVELFERVN